MEIINYCSDCGGQLKSKLDSTEEKPFPISAVFEGKRITKGKLLCIECHTLLTNHKQSGIAIFNEHFMGSFKLIKRESQ